MRSRVARFAGRFSSLLFFTTDNAEEKIKSIQSIENLRAITRKVHKTGSLEEFMGLVNKAVEN